MNQIYMDHIALEASAGTGKTFQLSLRVTELLLKGIQPKNILCLTFTKKATAEMKDRIIENILKFADGKYNSDSSEYKIIYDRIDSYKKALGKDKKSTDEFIKDQAIKARDAIFQSYSDLNIKTIDSFVSGILKMFPYEAGIRPDFEIQSLESHLKVFDETFDDVFTELIKDPTWKNIFNDIAPSLDDELISFIEKTKNYLSNIYDNYIVLKNKVDQEIDTKTFISLIQKAQQIQQSIISIKDDYANSISEPTSDRAKKSHLTFKNYTNVKDILKNRLAQTGYHNHKDFIKVNRDPNYDDLFFQLNDKIKEYIEVKSELIEKFVLYLFSKIITSINESKNKLNKFTFSDLTTLTSNMMNNDLIDTDYLYFRLDGRIDHILIDEFQDTSIAQWNILKPLIEESISGKGQNDKIGSFFYVGDPKQNIYRFRGGSSALFNKVYTEYSDRINHETLPKNYRSGKYIVNYVNDLFTKIVSTKKIQYNSEDYSELKKQLDTYILNQQYDESKGDGYINFKINYGDVDNVGSSKNSKQSIEEYSVECINEAINNGWEYKDIAILVNTNSDGDQVFKYLLENNIPTIRETSSYLINTIEYNALMDLAKFIETGDEISFLKFVIAPNAVITLEDYKNDELIKNIKKDIYSKITYYAKKPIFEKILLLVQELQLLDRFNGKQDLINTLDIMASSCPNEYNFVTFKETLDELVSSVQSVSVKKSNAITIMTIHKSKGLQFPVIILPTISKKIKLNKNLSNFFITNPDKPDYSDLRYVNSKDELSYIDGTERYFQHNLEEGRIFLDAINFLYVAMTRAEQALFMLIDVPKDKVQRDFEKNNSFEDLNDLSDFIFFILQNSTYQLQCGDLKECKKHASNKNNTESVVNEDKLYDLPLAPLKPRFKRDEFHKQSFEGEIFGSALHEGLRFLDGNNRNSIDTAINKIKNNYELLLNEESMSTIKHYIENIFNNTTWLNLFEGHVFKERSIGKTVNKTKELYAIDVYSIIDNKKIILCDYKTGNIDEHLDKYKNQVLKYAEILRDLYEIHDIEQYLINFYNGKISVVRINEDIIL